VDADVYCILLNNLILVESSFNLQQ
jgi:hypothetical protein